MTLSEFKADVWETLGLNNRSISFFHVQLDDRDMMGSGIVDCSGDLYDDMDFYELCGDLDDEPYVYVQSCVSYILGDGEVDHADYDDITLLLELQMSEPELFAQLLEEYAEVPCDVYDFEIENPAYLEIVEEDE